MPECGGIRHIGLAENGIGASGAKVLGTALRGAVTLLSLDLTRNEMGHAGGRAICDALRHRAVGCEKGPPGGAKKVVKKPPLALSVAGSKSGRRLEADAQGIAGVHVQTEPTCAFCKIPVLQRHQ